jgi:hypothetical protein
MIRIPSYTRTDVSNLGGKTEMRVDPWKVERIENATILGLYWVTIRHNPYIQRLILTDEEGYANLLEVLTT